MILGGVRTRRWNQDTDDQWTYDEVGNVTRATNANETADYSYDQRDRMSEALYAELKMRVGYGYDLAGRMSIMSYPGGETVRYERDVAGRVTAVVDSVAGRTEMGYDLLGRQVGQRWPNGLSETRSYDSAGRLLSITPITPGEGT